MSEELMQDVVKDTARRFTIRYGMQYLHADAMEVYRVHTDGLSSQVYRQNASQNARFVDAALVQLASLHASPGEFFLEEDEVSRLFEVLDNLANSGRVRVGIQHIFVTVNAWLVSGRFDLCRKALGQVDPKKLGPDLALSFLTITFAAKQQLNPYRAKLLNDLRKVIEKSRGARVAETVLRNLR